MIGPTAKINATIVTKRLISHGEIQGDVAASEQVVLKGTAVQTGEIITPFIVMESGCSIFNGSCVTKRETGAELPQNEPVRKAVPDSTRRRRQHKAGQ